MNSGCKAEKKDVYRARPAVDREETHQKGKEGQGASGAGSGPYAAMKPGLWWRRGGVEPPVQETH